MTGKNVHLINKYKRFFSYLFIIAAVCMATSCREDPYQFLYGHWKIYKHTKRLGIGCLDESESNQMITYLMGKEFVLAKNHAILHGQRYDHPSYEIREENTSHYLIAFYVLPNQELLGIEQDSIKILNIYSDEKKENSLPIEPIEVDFVWSHCIRLYFDEIIYDKDELIISFDTDFFHLKKI